ncbi:EKC/KEOPS complex subunit TPRKB isoform X2 [Conger conger]|uniref:EKC/KEOPS complex subunit TPRKB isoform X2 n=1 Tax=Conger conger TaxID=82655 RepID=UPI002A5A48E6|nr:EKC/KEOPS complex subunit TPRKB isoform X2 [Conger conger]
MHLTQQLELFPEYTVTQLLFKDVKNAADLRKKAISGEIIGALINPSMVVDPFQVLLATNKALHLQKAGKMKTRSLFSEIIFNLSPTNNVVLVHADGERNNMDDIQSKVDGQQIPVHRVSSLSNIAKIKKLYKVTPQEELCGSLLDAVVCRMATKDVL